jgi:predicted  nucleic acid-binding Zn-ribbon protein
MQAQQRRILQLEGEMEALRVESGRQQEALVQQRAQTRAAEARIQELQQELDNNAGVTLETTADGCDSVLCHGGACKHACLHG